MARPLRIQFPGAIYHVISRGNGGMTIFHTDKDRSKFLSFMAEIMKLTSITENIRDIPKVQKFAGRPSLEVLFKGPPAFSKVVRNRLILHAHDVLAYTQREIGEFPRLHPGHISRLIIRGRKG